MTRAMITTAKAMLEGIVRQRALLLRTGRSMKDSQRMNTALAHAQTLLSRMPSEATVLRWLAGHKAEVLDMLPSTDKTRRQFIANLQP